MSRDPVVVLRRSSLVVAVLLVPSAAALAQGWRLLQSPQSPSARGFTSMAYDLARSVTVLYGGWNGVPLADTWEWNGTTWTQRTTVGAPGARCCYAMAYDLARARIVVFGGTDGGVDLNDTWEFDGLTWLQRAPVARPAGRRSAAMAFDPASGSVLLFGGGVGGSATQVFADTWTFDGTSWTQQQPANVPPARWAPGMATDMRNARVLMHGGDTANVAMQLEDTWAWNGSDWQQLAVVPAGPRRSRQVMTCSWSSGIAVSFGGFASAVVMGDSWVCDGVHWFQDVRTPAPAGRWSAAIAYDPVRDRSVLFGGFASSAGYLGDTWDHTSDGLATWVPFGAGCPGSAGTPSLQPVQGQRPVLGTTFVLELANVPATLCAFTFGLSSTSWNGTNLPFDLGALGMPGCTLLAAPDFVRFAVPTAGVAQLALPLPNVPAFAGAVFFDQAFALDPAANPLGVTAANAGTATAGTD